MALTNGLNWEQRLTIPLLTKQQLKAAFQFYEQLCEPYSSKNHLNQAYFKVTTESREKLVFVHTDYSMSSKNIDQLFSDDSVMEAIKRFDYSLVNYEHIHDMIQIICPEHGVFEQKAYSHKQGIGCKLCSTNNDNEEIKQKLIENGFEIISFKSTEIIVKDKYGTYKTTSSRVRENIYPTVKTCLNRNEYFINKAKEIHGDKYDYSLIDYKNSGKKIKIICPVHGEFEKLYGTHVLKEEGCPYCMEETGYFHKASFNSIDNIYLYILKCYGNNEKFYKIGITSKSDLKLRFKNNKDLPYNYEIIYFQNDNVNLICYLEKYLHRQYKKVKYSPLLYFQGCSECFTEINNYLNLIQQGKNSYESSANVG